MNIPSNQTVQILLATYQGSLYLREQIQSLVNQTYPHIKILARDDGSKDDTLKILQSYPTHQNFKWVAGDNLGVVRSFDNLLRQAEDAYCYAYCDQDDVWQPDKISRAIEAINTHPQDIPLLYFSQTELVDARLNSLNRSEPTINRPVGFGNALVQNVVTGCTLVMNHHARKLLIQVTPDWSQVSMHDWWAYSVISAFGKIIYDPYPSIKYRQHTHNQVGTKNLTLAKRLERFWKNDHVIRRQAKELERCYGVHIPDQKRIILDDFIQSQTSFPKRLKLILNGEVYRQKPLDHIILKGLLLLNRI